MLEECLRLQCLLNPDKPLIAGISGGPDSLCLLGILHESGYHPIVAHFNHKLRPESDLEAEAMESHARRLSLAFISDSADVREWSETQGLSIEEASRNLRYQFLFQAARKHQAQAVAVGHTADDQVETILMHFLRGAGLAGLKGMPYRLLLPYFDTSIPLVRPLLSLWRKDTVAYCQQKRIIPHYDSTNMDQTYFRNQLRHTLIPDLEKYNPRFKETLIRTSLALQGDYEIIQMTLEEKWEEAFAGRGEGWITFHKQQLAACEPSIQRGLLRKAGEQLRPGNRDIGYDALERAVQFIQRSAGKQVDFVNNLYLYSDGEKIILAAFEADPLIGNQFQLKGEVSLNARQEIRVGKDWLLSSDVIPANEDAWVTNVDPWNAWLDIEKTGKSLLVRSRRPGDRFQPLGMGGQEVKLKEFFIKQKIPRRTRDFWPLICVEETIAWIPGLRIAHPFRVTEKTKQVLKLSMKKLQPKV